MSDTISMKIEGLEELQESFDEIIRKYPDKAGELLQANARRLRKDVVEEVKKVTDDYGNSKKSLAKAGSYKISQLQGYGPNQYIEISAKSPHFHLVEHGHKLVKNGVNIGFVPGKHMMENTIKRHQEIVPDTVSNMLEEILKEGGFL